MVVTRSGRVVATKEEDDMMHNVKIKIEVDEVDMKTPMQKMRIKALVRCHECEEVLQRSSLGRHLQRRHGAVTPSVRGIPFKPINVGTSGKRALVKFKDTSSADEMDVKVDVKKGRPRKVYACGTCSREFTFSGNMRRHVKRIHDPEREQKLAEKRRLRAELRARKKPVKRESSVERDYRTGRFMCDCGRGYLEKGNLRRHQHKNHGKPLKRQGKKRVPPVERKKKQIFETTKLGCIVVPERDVFDDSSSSEASFYYLDLDAALQPDTNHDVKPDFESLLIKME